MDMTAANGRVVHDAAVTCAGTAGAASFACTLSPQATGRASRFMTARVTLIDRFQNPVTNPSGAGVMVSLCQFGGASLSGASVSIPAGSASSAPFTEKLTDGKAQGTVSATATLGSAQAIASLTSWTSLSRAAWPALPGRCGAGSAQVRPTARS